MSPRVVVVGGGLAGITAAIALAEAGAQVTLLEARPRLGGATCSFSRDGLTVDTGQHVYLGCCSAYRGLLEQLGMTAHAPLQDRFDVTVLAPASSGQATPRSASSGGTTPPAPRSASSGGTTPPAPRKGRLRRTALPGPLHMLPALARYPFLSWAERSVVSRPALAMRFVDPAKPAVDEQRFGDWLAARGQSGRARRALWDLFTVSALNIAGDDASLALAATVVKTGLLGKNNAADIGVPALPLGELHGDAGATVLAKLGGRVLLGAKVSSIDPAPPAAPSPPTDSAPPAAPSTPTDSAPPVAPSTPAASAPPAAPAVPAVPGAPAGPIVPAASDAPTGPSAPDDSSSPRFLVRLARAADDEALPAEIPADAVVLAVPHDMAARLIPPGALPEATVAGWAGLGASPIVNVHVIYDRKVTDLPFAAAVDSPVQWVFDRTHISGLDRLSDPTSAAAEPAPGSAQGSETGVSAPSSVVEPGFRSAADAPDGTDAADSTDAPDSADAAGGGRQPQYLAISLSAADEYVDVPAAQLREQFVPALAELFPAAREAQVTEFFVTRERRATFRQAPGTAKLRPPAGTNLAGLVLAGAWTATGWPDTMEGAVRSGLSAAIELRKTVLSTGLSAGPNGPLTTSTTIGRRQ